MKRLPVEERRPGPCGETAHAMQRAIDTLEHKQVGRLLLYLLFLMAALVGMAVGLGIIF